MAACPPKHRREKKASVTFLSDPEKPVVNSYSSSGAHDYRDLSERRDVLTFDSAPLERDTEVTGPIHAQIYLACDCRDTDLWVRLLDVAPDGTAFNLMSPGLDVLRASYRDLKKGRQLLKPNRVYELHLDNLITSNVFRKGPSHTGTDFGDLLSELLAQSAHRRAGKFVGQNAEGEHLDLHRPAASFAYRFAGRFAVGAR